MYFFFGLTSSSIIKHIGRIRLGREQRNTSLNIYLKFQVICECENVESKPSNWEKYGS